jgi:hypothetical protein
VRLGAHNGKRLTLRAPVRAAGCKRGHAGRAVGQPLTQKVTRAGLYARASLMRDLRGQDWRS